jgi:hypothetical protein
MIKNHIRYQVSGYSDEDRKTLTLLEILSDAENAYAIFYARKDVHYREVQIGEIVKGKFIATATEAQTMRST